MASPYTHACPTLMLLPPCPSPMSHPHAPLFQQAPTVEEVTPYSLPQLLLRGKPLAILLLSPDGSALLSALPPVPPLTTLAWLNHSRYQHVLGKLGQVYGIKLPSLIVMDTTESQVSFICPSLCMRGGDVTVHERR